jgi:hypothetical protein
MSADQPRDSKGRFTPKQVDDAVRRIEDSADPNAVIMSPGPTGVGLNNTANAARQIRSNAVDEQFPTSGLQDSDPRDEIMTTKLALQNQQTPGITPFGQLQAKDSDFEWLQRKRETEAYANFQQWFAINFDKMSPPQKEMAKKLFPRFYQERLKQLDRTVELQKKLAKLKLLGPEDANDLMLQYAAEAGYIDAEPLHHILHPEEAAKQQNAQRRQLMYGRGLLNPRRLARGDFGQATRKYNAERIFGPDRIPGGTDAAYNLGTGNVGFSAFGNLSSDPAQANAEHLANTKALYGNIYGFTQ